MLVELFVDFYSTVLLYLSMFLQQNALVNTRILIRILIIVNLQKKYNCFGWYILWRTEIQKLILFRANKICHQNLHTFKNILILLFISTIKKLCFLILL